MWTCESSLPAQMNAPMKLVSSKPMCQKSPMTVAPGPMSAAMRAPSATWRRNGVSLRRSGSSTMEVPCLAACSASRLPVFSTKSLQRVLRAQLRQPGDVSAVIEAPSNFLLYVCVEKTAQILRAASLSTS